ncbi:hypothetical protein [Polaromonas sp. UC242_47]
MTEKDGGVQRLSLEGSGIFVAGSGHERLPIVADALSGEGWRLLLESTCE